MRTPRTIGAILSLVAGFTLLTVGPAFAAKQEAVGNGTKVTLEYTLTLPDNTVADSTVGHEPMSYVHGAHQIIPGLERELTGMKVGEKKQITVPSNEAYGPYDEKNKITIPKERAPNNVQVGMLLRAREGGQPVRVIEVKENDVVLDTNHPLAGKDLRFDVKILNVEAAPLSSKESQNLP